MHDGVSKMLSLRVNEVGSRGEESKGEESGGFDSGK